MPLQLSLPVFLVPSFLLAAPSSAFHQHFQPGSVDLSCVPAAASPAVMLLLGGGGGCREGCWPLAAVLSANGPSSRKLLLHLPHPVDAKSGRACFLAEKGTLEVTLRMQREFDFINFA